VVFVKLWKFLKAWLLQARKITRVWLCHLHDPERRNRIRLPLRHPSFSEHQPLLERFKIRTALGVWLELLPFEWVEFGICGPCYRSSTCPERPMTRCQIKEDSSEHKRIVWEYSSGPISLTSEPFRTWAPVSRSSAQSSKSDVDVKEHFWHHAVFSQTRKVLCKSKGRISRFMARHSHMSKRLFFALLNDKSLDWPLFVPWFSRALKIMVDWQA